MSGKSCDKMLSDDQGEFRKPNGVSVAVTAVRDAEEQSGAVVQLCLAKHGNMSEWFSRRWLNCRRTHYHPTS